MPEEQSPQMVKLGDRIIRKSWSLITFQTQNADAHMCTDYHIHVISAVSNCQSCLPWRRLSDQFDNFSLLSRWWSVQDYRFGAHNQLHYILFQLWLSNAYIQGFSAQHDLVFCGPLALHQGVSYSSISLFWINNFGQLDKVLLHGNLRLIPRRNNAIKALQRLSMSCIFGRLRRFGDHSARFSNLFRR